MAVPDNSNSPRRTGLQRVFARPNRLYTLRTLSLLRTTPLYTSVVATCHGTISTEPRATTRTAPSAPNRPMTLPRSQGAPESPRTDRLQPRARAHPSRGAFWPLHTFGAEGHPSTPSAPKASAIRDRRGGLFLRNNAHKTQAASTLSLNHQSTLHQNNPKSHADRSRTLVRTWHDASEQWRTGA
jgi:hypothetical protein